MKKESCWKEGNRVSRAYSLAPAWTRRQNGARELGKKEGKKRKHSSSEDSTSGSSTTEEEELTETGEGLFAEKKRALRLTRRYPGSLELRRLRE